MEKSAAYARYRDKEVRSIRQELLTADIRTQLPGLYANEAIGLSALARVSAPLAPGMVRALSGIQRRQLEGGKWRTAN